MAAILEVLAGQVLDKLADLVVGPAVGTVTATIAVPGPFIVPQGQVGTLPDGRRVRVRKSARVRFGTASLDCRLEQLTPSYPAAGNFVPVGVGLTVTWIAPPLGLAATATVASPGFAAGVLSEPARVGGVARHVHGKTGAEAFGAGAQGSTQAVLWSPRVRKLSAGGEHAFRREWYEVLWRIRFWNAGWAPQKDSRAALDGLFNSVLQVLQGATVGNHGVRVDGWEPVLAPDGSTTVDLTFAAHVMANGRAMVPDGFNPATKLAAVDSAISLSGDSGAAGPHRVSVTLPGRAFSSDFGGDFG